MEYAKDVVLNLKSGKETSSRDWRRARNRRKSNEKIGIFSKLWNKLLRHKIITTITIITIGFIAVDIYLVNIFINILFKI